MPLNLFRTPNPGLGKITAEQNISPKVRQHIQLIQFSDLSGDIPSPRDSSSLKSMALRGFLSSGCFPCAKEPSVAFSSMDLSSLCLSPCSLPRPCCLPISAFPTFQQWVCFSWIEDLAQMPQFGACDEAGSSHSPMPPLGKQILEQYPRWVVELHPGISKDLCQSVQSVHAWCTSIWFIQSVPTYILIPICCFFSSPRKDAWLLINWSESNNKDQALMTRKHFWWREGGRSPLTLFFPFPSSALLLWRHMCVMEGCWV